MTRRLDPHTKAMRAEERKRSADIRRALQWEERKRSADIIKAMRWEERRTWKAIQYDLRPGRRDYK